MSIRPAHHDDLEQINNIYNQAIGLRMTADTHPVSMLQRREWFLQHEPAMYPVFVYKAEGVVAGWLSFSPYRSGRQALRQTAEISYYIDEAFRGKGIGTKLVNFALKEAPSLALHVLFAIILEHNTASIALMKKCGFKQWGFLPEVANFDGDLCGQVYYGMVL